MPTPIVLAIADAFDELHELVMSEPGLSDFSEVVSALVAVGERARLGQSVEVVVLHNPHAKIPTRELAERILAIVNRAPGLIGYEDADTIRTWSVLHANLARAVFYTISKNYQELIPSEEDGDPEDIEPGREPDH